MDDHPTPGHSTNPYLPGGAAMVAVNATDVPIPEQPVPPSPPTTLVGVPSEEMLRLKYHLWWFGLVAVIVTGIAMFIGGLVLALTTLEPWPFTLVLAVFPLVGALVYGPEKANAHKEMRRDLYLKVERGVIVDKRIKGDKCQVLLEGPNFVGETRRYWHEVFSKSSWKKYTIGQDFS